MILPDMLYDLFNSYQKFVISLIIFLSNLNYRNDKKYNQLNQFSQTVYKSSLNNALSQNAL